MRLSQNTLRTAILSAVVLVVPWASSFGQGFFGRQGGPYQQSGGEFGNDGGEGGPSTNDWLPGLLGGGLQLLDRIDRDDQYIDEDPEYYDPPQQTRPRPQPVEEQPRPNKVPPKATKAKRNSPFTALALSAADIAFAKDQVKNEIQKDRDDLKKLLPTKADTEAFLVSQGINPIDAKKIASEMESGYLSPASTTLLGTLNPADQTKVAEVLEAHKQINAATEAAISGKLSNTQLQDVATALGPFVPPGSPAATSANNTLNSLGTSGGLMTMLDSAQAGLATIPGGGNVLLGLIPSLPPGTVIPLGPGAALLGTSLLGSGSGPVITTGSVAQTLGVPVGSNPAPESEAKPVSEGVYLVNCSDSEVNYVLNGKSYTMQTGYSQTLAAGKTWTVSFDKGNDQGTARYTLEPGTYAFNTTDGGWDLFKQSFEVTIDNSRSTFEFHYVLDNQAQVVAAGEKQEHSSAYPMQIRFDAGNGKTKQKKLEKGTFEVGLSLADNSIELYDGAADGNQVAAGGNPSPTINLFGGSGSTPPAAGGGSLNLFGGSAAHADAPWQRSNFFGGSTEPAPTGSSFLAPTPPATGAAAPAPTPVKATEGTLSGSSREESLPRPAPAP